MAQAPTPACDCNAENWPGFLMGCGQCVAHVELMASIHNRNPSLDGTCDSYCSEMDLVCAAAYGDVFGEDCRLHDDCDWNAGPDYARECAISSPVPCHFNFVEEYGTNTALCDCSGGQSSDDCDYHNELDLEPDCGFDEIGWVDPVHDESCSDWAGFDCANYEYWDDGYDDFDWEQLEAVLQNCPATCRLRRDQCEALDVRPTEPTSTNSVTPPTTTNSPTPPPTVDCGQHACGVDCRGDCGWNSDTMDCEHGKFTEPYELTMGNCPTVPAPSMATDNVSSISPSQAARQTSSSPSATPTVSPSGSPTTGGMVDGSSQESGNEAALPFGVTIGFGALSTFALCGMVAVFWYFKREAQTERRSMHRVKALTVQAEVAEARKRMSHEGLSTGAHGLSRSFSVTSNPYFPGPQGDNNQRPSFYPSDPTYETAPRERRLSAEHLYAEVDSIDADVAGYVKPELAGASEINPSKPACGVRSDSLMLYKARTPEVLEFGRPDGDDLYADFGVSSAPDFVPKKTFGRGPNQAVYTTAPTAAVPTKGAATALPDRSFGFDEDYDV